MKRIGWPLYAVLGLAVSHAFGGRAATSALAGIVSSPTTALLGVTYALLWILCAVVVPAQLLGALAEWLVTRGRDALRTRVAARPKLRA